MKIIFRTNILFIIISIMVISAVSAAPDTSGETPKIWRIKAASSVFIPDVNFFGASAAPGLSSGLEFRISGLLSIKQGASYYRTRSGDKDFDIFTNSISILFHLAGREGLYPVISGGIAFVSANPPSATGKRKTFKPTQTVFCLSAGAGAVYSEVTENISISGMLSVLATPYRYRKYIFDECRALSQDSQFTNLQITLGILYGF